VKRVSESAGGGFRSLIVNEQKWLEIEALKKKKAGVQAALQHLQEALRNQ